MIWLRLICYCVGYAIGSVIGVFLALKTFDWMDRREERKRQEVENKTFFEKLSFKWKLKRLKKEAYKRK